MTQTTNRKPRRMAREKQPQAQAPQVSPDVAESAQPSAKSPSRLDQLQVLLAREGGATIAQMVEATGWQQHSVRGAMAGALKKRGLTITSEKFDGTRRYRAKASV